MATSSRCYQPCSHSGIPHGRKKLGSACNDASTHGMASAVTQETLQHLPFMRALLGLAQLTADSSRPWVHPQIELIAGADTQPHTDTCAAPSPRPMGSHTSRIPHPLAYLTLSHTSESHAWLLAGALLTPFAPSPVPSGSGLRGAVASA